MGKLNKTSAYAKTTYTKTTVELDLKTIKRLKTTILTNHTTLREALNEAVNLWLANESKNKTGRWLDFVRASNLDKNDVNKLQSIIDSELSVVNPKEWE